LRHRSQKADRRNEINGLPSTLLASFRGCSCVAPIPKVNPIKGKAQRTEDLIEWDPALAPSTRETWNVTSNEAWLPFLVSAATALSSRSRLRHRPQCPGLLSRVPFTNALGTQKPGRRSGGSALTRNHGKNMHTTLGEPESLETKMCICRFRTGDSALPKSREARILPTKAYMRGSTNE
jgi:hypothetical protein